MKNLTAKSRRGHVETPRERTCGKKRTKKPKRRIGAYLFKREGKEKVQFPEDIKEVWGKLPCLWGKKRKRNVHKKR